MDERYSYLPANCIIKPPSPQCIIVNQVIGEQDVQEVIEIRLVVPKHKPAIEQVVDVLVKKLCISNVEVLSHKVIVRGHFELKALYVACLPSQPVHALSAHHVRFTAAAHIHGCHHGLDADAHAVVEYVDYSACRRPFRKFRTNSNVPKWKKYHHHKDDCGCEPNWDDDYDCESDCKPDCEPCEPDHHTCKPDCKPDCKPCKPKPKPCKHSHCCRAIDATVIIRVHIKVTKDRELFVHAGDAHHLPYKPKG